MKTNGINNLDEAKIFVDGCTFLGTGGGGQPTEGLRVLKEVIEEKGAISWINVDEIADDAVAICAFLMGSTAPLTEEKIAHKESLGMKEPVYTKNIFNAINEWEEYTGKKADIIVPLEIGGSNLPVPMAIGKFLDKTVVDGDYAGRAIPEIFQISLVKESIGLCPAVSVDKFGNVCIIKEAINLHVEERIGKYLSEVSFGSTAIAGFLVTGKQLKRLLIRGSMSRAFKVGKLICEAKEECAELKEKLADEGFTRIFVGKVVKKDWCDEGGYYMGTHYMEGSGCYAGEKLKMYFKNETHLVWLAGECVAMSPDLICTIDPNTYKPLRNDDIEEGTEIEVYVGKCNPIFKGKEVIKYLEPRYFGFDIDYKEWEG